MRRQERQTAKAGQNHQGVPCAVGQGRHHGTKATRRGRNSHRPMTHQAEQRSRMGLGGRQNSVPQRSRGTEAAAVWAAFGSRTRRQ